MGEDLYSKNMKALKKEFIKLRENTTMSAEDKRKKLAEINEKVKELKKSQPKDRPPRMTPHERAAVKEETRKLWGSYEEEER